VNDLEKKRRVLLKEAKRVEKMGQQLDGDIAKAQDMLKPARNMEEKYVTLIQNQMTEGGDPQLVRNLEFTVQLRKLWPRCISRIRHMWTRTAMKSGLRPLRTSWLQRSYWSIIRVQQP
jgi:hypothetical protein